MKNLDLKAVISAEDKTAGAFRSFNTSLLNIGKQALKFGSIAGGAIATAGAFAIKSASDVEMLRTNLDTLTGSAENGAKVFKEISVMAAKTPFETTDLVKATSTMLAFGVAQKDIMPNLKMLGDVSLGNRVKFDALSLAFSQVQSTGRLMGQDLLQMVNQGFNPLQIISEKTGKSMSVLKKEMEGGKISAEMVTEAFKIATSEGGRFYQGMDRGAKTLQGTISTLKDNIGILARGIVGLSDTGDIVKGGLFDKFASGVQNVNAWLETNKETIDRYTVSISSGLSASIGWLVENLKIAYQWFIETKNKIVEFFTATETGRSILQYFQVIIGFVVEQAKRLWQIIMDNKEMLKELGVGLAILIGGAIAGFIIAVGSVLYILGKLVQYMDWVRDASASMRDGIVAVFKAIVFQIKWPINQIITGINLILTAFGKIPGAKKIGLIPSFQTGGIMPYDGIAYLHKGERVTPSASVTNNNTPTINFYGNITNTSNASLDAIGQRIGRQIQLVSQGI